MAHRIGLFLGSIAAAVVVAAALLAAGLGPTSGSPAAADSSSAAASQPDVSDAPQPWPTTVTQVDTVYVRPAPTPKTIKVVKKAPPVKAPATPQVVVVTGDAGDGEGGRGEGND